MAPAHSGSYSGWVFNRVATFQGPVQDITQSVMEGQTYVTSAWAMVAYPNDGGFDASPTSTEPVALTAAVSCIVDGATTTRYLPIGSATGNAQTWAFINGSFTVPFCELSSLQVHVSGPEPGVDLLVDDVGVVPG